MSEDPSKSSEEGECSESNSTSKGDALGLAEVSEDVSSKTEAGEEALSWATYCGAGVTIKSDAIPVVVLDVAATGPNACFEGKAVEPVL